MAELDLDLVDAVLVDAVLVVGVLVVSCAAVSRKDEVSDKRLLLRCVVCTFLWSPHLSHHVDTHGWPGELTLTLTLNPNHNPTKLAILFYPVVRKVGRPRFCTVDDYKRVKLYACSDITFRENSRNATSRCGYVP